MKQILTTAVLLCAMLVFLEPAHAGHKEFANFSIDLPDNWSVEYDGLTVAFVVRDKSANMQVTVEDIANTAKEGMGAKGLAEAYAAELDGSTPKMVDDDQNYYSFTFRSPEGVEAEASIVVSDHLFYLITISGHHKDLAGMVESVLLSIM